MSIPRTGTAGGRTKVSVIATAMAFLVSVALGGAGAGPGAAPGRVHGDALAEGRGAEATVGVGS